MQKIRPRLSAVSSFSHEKSQGINSSSRWKGIMFYGFFWSSPSSQLNNKVVMNFMGLSIFFFILTCYWTKLGLFVGEFINAMTESLHSIVWNKNINLPNLSRCHVTDCRYWLTSFGFLMNPSILVRQYCFRGKSSF